MAKARDIRDVEPETLVVVKSLLMKDEHLFFEFRQEMEMYSKLDHPFIVKLLGVCRDLEPHFMIMEYCDWVRKILSTELITDSMVVTIVHILIFKPLSHFKSCY